MSTNEDDYREGDDQGAATHHYAGPFCGCGDFSCDINQCANGEQGIGMTTAHATTHGEAAAAGRSRYQNTTNGHGFDHVAGLQCSMNRS
ncbi:hypothetical protein FXW78_26285 [Rhodococcus opacus]|nr:hypothetical protein [Rhodococcus opacus]